LAADGKTAGGLRVLWATDGSDDSLSAVPLLRGIVLPAASRLAILSVAPHSFISGSRPDPVFLTRTTPALRRRALTEAEQVAQHAATLLNPDSLSLEAMSRWGNPISEVLRAARIENSDLIVLGAKGHSALRLVLLGSVSQGVVQNAQRSVLVARPGVTEVKRVVAGIDGTPRSRRAVQFLLERLSLSPDVLVRLVNVLEPLPKLDTTTLRRVAGDEKLPLEERRRRQAERHVETLAASLRAQDRRVETEVLEGKPAVVLDNSARQHGAQLIVVGSRRPSPASRFLIGTTAEQLARHARTSVLIVR
jgi:nucleotide-binding universal stress UspA family protein